MDIIQIVGLIILSVLVPVSMEFFLQNKKLKKQNDLLSRQYKESESDLQDKVIELEKLSLLTRVPSLKLEHIKFEKVRSKVEIPHSLLRQLRLQERELYLEKVRREMEKEIVFEIVKNNLYKTSQQNLAILDSSGPKVLLEMEVLVGRHPD